MTDLAWYVLRTAPQSEFKVQTQLNQREHMALVPYEEKWRRRNSQSRHKVLWKYPYFARYVFVGILGWSDYLDIRDNVDQVQGILCSNGQPGKLSLPDVHFVQSMARQASPHSVGLNPHRALQVGGDAHIIEGPFSGHSVRVQSIVAKRAQVLMQALGNMSVVSISVAALEAA